MMDTYGLLREFADSWALVALTLVFIGAVVWAWRPGSERLHEDAAKSIFRNDVKPVADRDQKEA